MRDWIVMMHTRSAVRLIGDERVRVDADEASTAPLKSIRLRNAFATVDEKLVCTGLIAEAWGEADGAEHAVDTLAQWAGGLLQVAALAANACVQEPKWLLAYAPPTSERTGEFVEQRPCGLPVPVAKIRSLSSEDLGAVLGSLNGHFDEARLQRAVAHYASALSALDPFNRVMSAQHLWMACENLGQVVLRRLCRDAGLPTCEFELGESKHLLAVAAGFEPKGNSRQHLYDFDSHLRVEEIFGGDRATYTQLREASDSFEHGYAAFGEVQAAAHASADRAFELVRAAILRELVVPATSALSGAKYECPLAGWPPSVVLAGTYASETEEEWPHFYGANMIPEVTHVEDVDDDTRNLTLRIDASGASLLEGQQLSVRRTTWAMPSAPDSRIQQVGEPEVVVRKADGTQTQGEATSAES